MVLSRYCLLTGITLAVGIVFPMLSKCQTITKQINDLSKSLILDTTISNCIHQTVVNRNYHQSKEFLKILSTSVDKLKYEILQPMTNQKNIIYGSESQNLFDIYTNLKSIVNNVKSIQCKKKIKKKGVMKKIKKYMTTEEPLAEEEEKEILESHEDFDGWTYENLQLMKKYYAEMQKELAEIRELCPS